MRYFYLKGMSATKDEINFIKDKFESEGIQLENLVDDYATFLKKSDNEICEFLSQKINSFDDEVCLICHSMGCNFAFLTYPQINNLRRVVLVSPEFKTVSKEEKERIEESIKPDKFPTEIKRMSINKIKNIAMFLRSKKWIKKFMQCNLSYICPVDIFYSKGDKFVSQDAIRNFSRFKGVEVFEIDSNNHNPILESDDIILEIKRKTSQSRK